jgi:hypothetical protein
MGWSGRAVAMSTPEARTNLGNLALPLTPNVGRHAIERRSNDA